MPTLQNDQTHSNNPSAVKLVGLVLKEITQMKKKKKVEIVITRFASKKTTLNYCFL